MLYLINLELTKHYYPNETISTAINHIVEADNEESARDKVSLFYDRKDVDDYVSHEVVFNYCNECIN